MDRTNALSELALMFPQMERDILDAVLRANNNVLEASIDNLLAMTDPSATQSQPQQPQQQQQQQPSAQRSQQPPSAHQEAPREVHWADPSVQVDFRREFESLRVGGTEGAVPPYSLHAPPSQSSGAGYWRDGLVDQGPPPLEPIAQVTSSASSAVDTPSRNRPAASPIIGRLPDDFLILLTKETRGGSKARTGSQVEQDELFARMLQNEEFMQQLDSNPEFRQALDADRRRQRTAARTNSQPTVQPATATATATTTHAQNTVATTAATTTSDGKRPSASEEDVPFMMRLQSMGDATKKKFQELAQKFTAKSAGGPTGSPLRYSSLPGGDEADANLLGESDDELLDEPALEDGRLGNRGGDARSDSSASMNRGSTKSPRRPSQLALQ